MTIIESYTTWVVIQEANQLAVHVEIGWIGKFQFFSVILVKFGLNIEFAL